MPFEYNSFNQEFLGDVDVSGNILSGGINLLDIFVKVSLRIDCYFLMIFLKRIFSYKMVLIESYNFHINEFELNLYRKLPLKNPEDMLSF